MQTATFIGAGNLANSLAPALYGAGVRITQVCSRTLSHAAQLARKVDAQVTDRLAELAPADFVFVCVPDDSIASTVAALALSDDATTVVHVSGSVSIDVLKPFCKNYGVFYPLQTFSIARPVDDFTTIPVFLEANSKSTLMKIAAVAGKISSDVVVINSEARMGLHVAAVFACNFVNSLLAVAFDLCKTYRLAPEYLKPLVAETCDKAFASGSPDEVQTGPAARGDIATMEKHLQLLKNSATTASLYKTLSANIADKKHKTKILFVCMGNICRSPAAEGIFKKKIADRGLADKFTVDSAGLISYHEGEPCDNRMRVHGRKRGYVFDSISRPVTNDDFRKFDLILCMDDDVLESLRDRTDNEKEIDKLRRMTDYCLTVEADDVPDPYYGGDRGFETVMDILEDACEGLLKLEIRN
jgi:protein-tyrosine phosphatase